MDADQVVIEYLRSKLKSARAGRAEGILKPKVEAEMPADETSPEELAQLEALMGGSGGLDLEVEPKDEDEE